MPLILAVLILTAATAAHAGAYKFEYCKVGVLIFDTREICLAVAEHTRETKNLLGALECEPVKVEEKKKPPIVPGKSAHR
jgi:hypothetical protein